MLFTNARDEKHIKEWAAHHLLIGFDHVYIFDHKSTVPLTSEFAGFDTRVVVERCELGVPPKIPLMKRAAEIAANMRADWFIYLDADEFIILNNFRGVGILAENLKVIFGKTVDIPLFKITLFNQLMIGSRGCTFT